MRLFGFSLLLLFVASCFGASWYVSPVGSDSNSGTSIQSPFRTINKGFSASKNGDTIYLMPGLYSGSSNLITFTQSRIVQSQDISSPAVISSSTACFQVYAGYAAFVNVTFSGLQFSGCTSAVQASLYATGSSSIALRVIDSVFQGSTRNAISYNVNGGGISTLSVSNTKFLSCDTGITMGSSGGTGNSGGSIQILGSVFAGTGTTDKGIVSYNAAGSLTISGCYFESLGNTAVDISDMQDLTITNTTFAYNSNTALKLTSVASALIDSSNFGSNVGTNGGAMYMIGTASCNIAANNVYYFNNTASLGGAGYVSGATFNAQYCTINSNTATNGGDFYCVAGGRVYEYSCKSSGNTGGNGNCALSKKMVLSD